MGRPLSDKRERHVAAAVERFHVQGYAGTSIADVARAAGVPAGNVFYYFRAKEDLARAVIDAWCRELTEDFALLDQEPDPWVRLRRFVEGAAERRAGYLSRGCPLAGLARDLRGQGDALGAEVTRVYAVQHDWVRAQFKSLGFKPDEAEMHARFLMAGHNGAILMAYAQNDEGLILSGVSALRAWLEGLRAAQAA
jgi:AcrR family transcriptional regulator